MNLHKFGTTDLLVSPLGLGLAALGRPGYINLGHATDLENNYAVAAMEARAHQVLDAAWQDGVRYFDAARSYGRAEQFLGSWLQTRHMTPQTVTVGSKWGYTYTANWQIQADKHEIKDHSLVVLQRQWLESQANLGAYLQLYQIHSATLESGILHNLAVLRELARLKSNGVYIGLSLSGTGQAAVLQRAVTIILDGSRLFDSVQATWNLLEPSAGAALQEARTAGMGIIIKEALANGRLTERNNAPQLARLQQQARRLNTTVDALALAAVLAQPWVDMVLSGAVTIAQWQSNLQALQVQWDEEAATELATLAETSELYWQTRQSLAWN